MKLLESNRDDAARTGATAAAAHDRLISDVDATPVFVTARPRLFTIAFHILKDLGEAEDVVQEVWLRWKRADRSIVISPPAFLATTTERLAINVAKSARRRRETYAGPGLLDRADRTVSPETAAERHDAVDLAIAVLLEKLTPAELATYILRKAFDYPYSRIAEILHLSPDHARQLVRRAQEHIATGRRRPVDTAARQRLVRTFLAAAQTGNFVELEGLLAAGIVRKGVSDRESILVG
ncbi:MAG: sigma-70 family RNA polymerase sigma factor [Frankia sp.]